MSEVYSSTLDISFDVRGGLLIWQIHHWAALLFVASISVHLLRVFFTGAFRKPREINWIMGTVMFALAAFEGFAGYSLPDDLLSGTGIRIARAICRPGPRSARPSWPWPPTCRLSGSSEVMALHLDLPLYAVIWTFRAGFIAAPVVAFGVTKRVCVSRQRAVLEARRPDGLYIPVPRHLIPLPTPRRVLAQVRAGSTTCT